MIANSKVEDYRPRPPKLYKSGNRLFLSFLQSDPLRLVASIILMIFGSLTITLPAVLIGSAIDIVFTSGINTAFKFEVLKILGVGVINYIITFLAFYNFITVSFKFERDLRQNFADQIQDHSLTFHDENNTSELLSMGMSEISQIRVGVMPAARALFQNLFMLVFTLYFIWSYTNLFQATITFSVFLLYYILAIIQAKRIAPVRTNLARAQASMTENSQEIFKGVEVVRASQGTTREILKFNKLSEEYAKNAERETKMGAFYTPNLLILLLTGTLFAINIVNVSKGLMSVGDLIGIVGMLITIELSSAMLPQMFLILNAALTNADRVHNKMAWEDPNPEVLTNGHEVDWDGEIVFDNVTFSYREGLKPALRNISLTIPKNAKVSVIGGPGSGKSSFLKLILQLYIPTSGRITIGGTDIAKLPSFAVREHVTRVEQEVFLFSGKISENIAFACPEATRDEIMAAADAAQALEFIDQLPDGIDTIIGERGVDLSGGQRQRLAIARAILADSNILLLDDNASALDAKTEELLKRALDNISRNRLTITVTQRLNTLVNSDMIILLEKGSVLDIGTHTELLSRCDEYKQIFKLLPKSEQLGGMN